MANDIQNIKTTEFEPFFKKDKLVNSFSDGGFLDYEQIDLFKTMINLEDKINFNHFCLNSRTFSNESPQDKTTQNITGNIENGNAFSVKMAILSLYSSISYLDKKYKKQKESIEKFFDLSPIESFSLNDYVYLKKLERAFGIEGKNLLDKFLPDIDDLKFQFDDNYGDDPESIYENKILFISKATIAKDKKLKTEDVENEVKENSQEKVVIDDSDLNKVESKNSSDKMRDILIFNIDNQIDSYLEEKILKQNVSFEKINNERNQLIEDLNSEQQNSKKMSSEFFNVVTSDAMFIMAMTKLVNNLDSSNELKDCLTNDVLKMIIDFSKENRHLGSSYNLNKLESISETSKEHLKTYLDSITDKSNLKFSDYESLFKSIAQNDESIPNLIALNMLNGENHKNISLIASIKTEDKKDKICQMFIQEFVNNNNQLTSALDVYLEKDILTNDFDNSFSKPLSNSRVVVNFLSKIFNQELSDETCDNIMNKIINSDLNDGYQEQEVKNMFTAQNKNIYFMDSLIDEMRNIIVNDTEKGQKILNMSLKTAISSGNMKNVNDIINYIKTDILNLNVIDNDFVSKSFNLAINNLRPKELSELIITQEDIDKFELSILKKHQAHIKLR